LASDDCSSVWINTTPNDPTSGNMKKIASMTCCAPEYNYFSKITANPTDIISKQISDPVTLAKD
jgi:hypothetical protein